MAASKGTLHLNKRSLKEVPISQEDQQVQEVLKYISKELSATNLSNGLVSA